MQKATLEFDLSRLDGLDDFMAAKNGLRYRIFIKRLITFIEQKKGLNLTAEEVLGEAYHLAKTHSLDDIKERLL